jgi:hypothetical protein
VPDDLPEDALVVRGGTTRDPADVLEKVQDAIGDGDGPVLSVYVDVQRPGESVEDCVRRICTEADIPHGKIQVSRMGRLGAKFKIVRDVDPGQASCHHHVDFESDVNLGAAQEFIDSFDEPIPNPTGGRRRRA